MQRREMAKLPEPRFVTSWVSAAIHANRTCLQTGYRADTASDPKIEWPLIADYDIELVAGFNGECGDSYRRRSTTNHARASRDGGLLALQG